jgi:hypothetical protein
MGSLSTSLMFPSSAYPGLKGFSELDCDYMAIQEFDPSIQDLSCSSFLSDEYVPISCAIIGGIANSSIEKRKVISSRRQSIMGHRRFPSEPSLISSSSHSCYNNNKASGSSRLQPFLQRCPLPANLPESLALVLIRNSFFRSPGETQPPGIAFLTTRPILHLPHLSKRRELPQTIRNI